jgi:hypothetical protein
VAAVPRATRPPISAEAMLPPPTKRMRIVFSLRFA